MRSIERSFNQIVKKNPGKPTLSCFIEVIHRRNFSKDKIREYFNLLVDKDDYAKEEKGQIMRYLYELTKDGL